MKLAIKRVYDPPAASDGLRILVDRLWPRGLRKEDAAVDLWRKDIAPSTELRKWFDHRADRYTEFQRRYGEELSGNPAVAELLATIGKAGATLLYSARDTEMNQATVLAAYLREAVKK
jgi:uncharacterized protein YeaO (DUF488 family)